MVSRTSRYAPSVVEQWVAAGKARPADPARGTAASYAAVLKASLRTLPTPGANAGAPPKRNATVPKAWANGPPAAVKAAAPPVGSVARAPTLPSAPAAPRFAWIDPAQILNSQATVSFVKLRANPYTLRDIMAGLKNNPVPPALIPDVVEMRDGALVAVDNSRIAAAKMLHLPSQCVRLVPENLALQPSERARFRVLTHEGRVTTPSTWGEAVKLRIQASRYDQFPLRFPEGMPQVPKITHAPSTPTWDEFRRLPWQRT